MEQNNPTVATVEIERMRPCINEDEECSWSGDEGCLCYPDPDKWVPVVKSGEKHYLQDFWSSLTTEEAFYVPKIIEVTCLVPEEETKSIEWLLRLRIHVAENFDPECDTGEGYYFPDPKKLLIVMKHDDNTHHLESLWTSFSAEGEVLCYIPKMIKILIKGDVKEMPIEWLFQKHVEIPEDFGKPKPPVPCDLPGQVLMYEKIVPEEAVAYYYATEGSDKKINGTEPGIAAIDALIDEEYKRGDTSIKIFNEDTGKFEIMSLREAMESSVFFPKEEEKK